MTDEPKERWSYRAVLAQIDRWRWGHWLIGVSPLLEHLTTDYKVPVEYCRWCRFTPWRPNKPEYEYE